MCEKQTNMAHVVACWLEHESNKTVRNNLCQNQRKSLIVKGEFTLTKHALLFELI